MAFANLDTPAADVNPSVVDRVADAARTAAHLSHEARLLKSVAEDTIEDGVHAARRAMKAVQRRVDDIKDDAIHGVKRQPLVAVGAAFGIGLAAGTLVALAASWRRRRSATSA
jgi:ElaB/YqjD/DUF883 family membrane-anchored ribosome-binding protein